MGDEEELERDYEIIAETVAPFADVLLCETMSCVREAFSVIMLVLVLLL